MSDVQFTRNELIAIYGTIRYHRDVANDMLDKMSENDPDREGFIKNNKIYNSILRKLNKIFHENGWEFKD